MDALWLHRYCIQGLEYLLHRYNHHCRRYSHCNYDYAIALHRYNLRLQGYDDLWLSLVD